MCFLCGLEADKNSPSVRNASTLPLREKMLENAQERGPDDDWALEVIGRLETCCDLVAEELAVYHSVCYLRFTSQMSKFNEGLLRGRPEDLAMSLHFDKLCEWLETNCETELLSLSEVHLRLQEVANGQEVYSIKHLKRKLQERYGEHIFLQKFVVGTTLCASKTCALILSMSNGTVIEKII